MATDVEALLLRIEANVSKFEKDMAKLNGTFDRQAKQLEERARSLGVKIGNNISGQAIDALKPLAGALSVAFAVDKVDEANQAYVRATNQLRVAGLAGTSLSTVFERLYTIAQENATPLETLTALYSKTAQAQKSLGASGEDLFSFTTAVAQTLRVTGRSAEESAGALLQLGQALTSGTVHAEEYNSLLENAYPLLQAAAVGLKEAGGEVSKLTNLVKTGEVSSTAFFKAILAGAPILQDKLAGAVKTNEQGVTQLQNSLIRFAGHLLDVTGLTDTWAKGIGNLSKFIDNMNGYVDFAIQKWLDFKKVVNDASKEALDAAGYNDKAYLATLGTGGKQDQQGKGPIALGREALNNQARLAGGFEDASKRPLSTLDLSAQNKVNTDRLSGAFALFDAKKDPIKTVSTKDYPATPKKKDGADSEDEYERATRKIKEKTAALEIDITTVGKSTEEITKAKEAQALKTAADQADLTLTPERKAEIESLSAAYAAQEAKLKDTQAALASTQETQRFFGQSITGVFSDIVSGGKNAEDAIMNLKKKLVEAALQAAVLGEGPLASLFGLKAKNAGDVGGLFGAILGNQLKGFATGGYTGPGPASGVAGVVHGGEYVFDKAATSRIGVANLEAMRRLQAIPGYADGGFVGLNLPHPRDMVQRSGPQVTMGGITINAPGADGAGLARVEQQVKALQKSLPAQVVHITSRMQTRRTYS